MSDRRAPAGDGDDFRRSRAGGDHHRDFRHSGPGDARGGRRDSGPPGRGRPDDLRGKRLENGDQRVRSSSRAEENATLGRINPAHGGDDGGGGAKRDPSDKFSGGGARPSPVHVTNRRRDDSHGGGGIGGGDHLPDMPKKKFTNRCRLFIGNLPTETKESELKELLEKYGDTAELYLSGKGFAFARLATRSLAEAAKEELDGHLLHGRTIRVRFAVHGASIRVKELSSFVSNELLYQAFSMFGEVERAVHIVDDKGRATGEGIVEYERKPAAAEAIRACKDNVFLLTGSPKPVIVEALDPKDDEDGLMERSLPRGQVLNKDREKPPRFAPDGSFENVFGNRWKELYQMEQVRKDQLDAELKEIRERLDNDMEMAFQDYQTQLMREELRRRTEDLDRMENAKRERMELMQKRYEEERAQRNAAPAPPGMNRFAGPPGPGGPPQQQQVGPFGAGVGIGGGQGGPFGGAPTGQGPQFDQQQQQPQFGEFGGGPPGGGGGGGRGTPFGSHVMAPGAVNPGGQPPHGGQPQGGPPHGGPGGPGRNEVANGVQSLMKMFKGGGGGGPPGSIPPSGPPQGGPPMPPQGGPPMPPQGGPPIPPQGGPPMLPPHMRQEPGPPPHLRQEPGPMFQHGLQQGMGEGGPRPQMFGGPSEGMRGPPEGFRGPPDAFRGPPEGFRGPPEGFRGPPEGFRGGNMEAFRGGPPPHPGQHPMQQQLPLDMGPDGKRRRF